MLALFIFSFVNGLFACVLFLLILGLSHDMPESGRVESHHNIQTSLFVSMLLIIILLIIYMKKLLDSDWLRAVQFKCNTSAKSVTPVQITHHNSDYD